MGKIKIDNQYVAEWNSQTSGHLVITHELFYRNANLLLKQYPTIEQKIKNQITKQLENLQYTTSKNKNESMYYKRVKADSINRALKKNFKAIPNITFEVEFKDGYFIDSRQTGGFDFAIFDKVYNLYNFRNYCFGARSIYNGESVWNQILYAKKEWRSIADNEHIPTTTCVGEDRIINKQSPTIVGEIQFGNWALLYYDFIKVLHIENLLDIDLFIYITPTGLLEKYISDGTVNFSKASEVIEKYHSILKMPIWLIGIDLQDNQSV